MKIFLISLFTLTVPVQALSWKVEQNPSYLKMYIEENKKRQFELTIGAGGSLNKFVYSPQNKNLLASSFQGEETDRVIQWVSWGTALKQEGTKVADHRFNINQAGDFFGNFNKILSVKKIDNLIEIYSLSERQWFPVLNKHFKAKVASLTQYEMLAGGVLKIKVYLLASHITQNGKNVGNYDYYLERWTPFTANNYFDLVVYSLDDKNSPDNYEKFGKNIAYYAGQDIEKLSGYVLTISKKTLKTPAVALIYGKKPLELISTSANGKAVLNIMSWDQSKEDKGMALLPGLYLYKVEPFSILEHTIYLAPTSLLNNEYRNRIETLSEKAESAKVYGPQAILGGNLLQIRQNLMDVYNKT